MGAAVELRRTPYSTDESRVENYLAGVGVGRGLIDPIGFLMVSHATLKQRIVSIAGINAMRIGPCEVVKWFGWSLAELEKLGPRPDLTEIERDRFEKRLHQARDTLKFVTR